MVGAAVATPDGRRGTVTDSNGRYSLTLGAGDALISVSYLGYVTRQIVIGDRTEVDVNLVPDAKNTINEVVVIGYGAVKKSDLTGSVSNVKMSDIRDVPNTSVDQALQGRIAGVDIMSTSGAPGATTSIRVRGTRSISASNEPLIVVDGVIDAVQRPERHQLGRHRADLGPQGRLVDGHLRLARCQRRDYRHHAAGRHLEAVGHGQG